MSVSQLWSLTSYVRYLCRLWNRSHGKRRTVQYLVVEKASDAWTDDAPGFFGTFDSKEALKKLVRLQPEVPQDGTLYVCVQGIFFPLASAGDLPTNDPVCVTIAKGIVTRRSSNTSLLFWFVPASRLRRRLLALLWLLM